MDGQRLCIYREEQISRMRLPSLEKLGLPCGSTVSTHHFPIVAIFVGFRGGTAAG